MGNGNCEGGTIELFDDCLPNVGSCGGFGNPGGVDIPIGGGGGGGPFIPGGGGGGGGPAPWIPVIK